MDEVGKTGSEPGSKAQVNFEAMPSFISIGVVKKWTAEEVVEPVVESGKLGKPQVLT